MKGQCVAAFGSPHPRRSLTGESDLLATEARLVAVRNCRRRVGWSWVGSEAVGTGGV